MSVKKNEINIGTVKVLECLFNGLDNTEYETVFDSAAYVYSMIDRKGGYPKEVVDAVYGALSVLSNLTAEQFLFLRQTMQKSM